MTGQPRGAELVLLRRDGGRLSYKEAGVFPSRFYYDLSVVLP